MQISRSCRGNRTLDFVHAGRVFTLDRCPVRIWEDNAHLSRYFAAFNDYEKGFLPGPGGIDDQDNDVVTAIRIIASEVNREANWQNRPRKDK